MTPPPSRGRSEAAGNGFSNDEGDFAVTFSAKREWLIPAGLIMLSFVPVVAGAVRVAGLSGGAEVTPDNARFFASPIPVVAHICTVTVYCLLGAFQFVAGFRRRRPGWHRAAGRILVPCGLIAALSGLWMTLFYPRPDDVGELLTGFRLVFGAGMILSIALGFAAILRRDFARHRAWMMRGYAIGMGAGTQAVTQLPWILAVGPLDKLSKAFMMLAAWVINLAVAEWIIRRHPSKPTRSSAGLTDALLALSATRTQDSEDFGFATTALGGQESKIGGHDGAGARVRGTR